MNTTTQPWDVIIIGGGPAGSAAAMVLARCRRRVLVIDEGKHRNIRTGGIHNYLTRDGITPREFTETTRRELKAYNVEVVEDRVTTVTALAQHGFSAEDSHGNKYLSRRLLIATGVTDNIPDIPGMQDHWGDVIHHCPYCDGWEACDKIIALYSVRFNGTGMAHALRQLTDKVILLTDGARYLSAEQRKRLDARNVEVVSGRLSRVEKTTDGVLVHLVHGDIVKCDCIFINHGNRVNNELVKQLGVKCKPNGSIPVSKSQACNVPGVYVAGDVVFDMQFVSLAAAEGVKAAVAIHDDLMKTDNFY